jgi:DNA-binding MurR/RpiR family transcriptional regulator
MILNRIKSEMSDFSKNHRLIAQHLLDNFREVAFLTAAQLAQRVGVSESTVFRFANTLGFQGYPELRSALQEDLMDGFSVLDREEAYTFSEEEDDLLLKGFRLDAQASSMERRSSTGRISTTWRT